MEKLSLRRPSSNKGVRELTYRARGIPQGLDVEGARTLLCASLEAEVLSLDSLAASSDGKKGRVATFRLSGHSSKLNGDRTEWLVPAARLDGAGGKQLLVDTHFDGFTPLHDPIGNSEDAFDCVAISGLGSHAFGSWKDRHSPYMWLRDALPEYLPNARVMIYGYDSKLVGSHSFQNLGDVGSRFRASLKVALGMIPRERPLIFMAHSLGGLVLKEAMVQMVSGSDADSRNFKATFGILFFGVPNQGMDISSLLSMVRGQPNLPFLSTLSKDGGFLQSLIEKFQASFAFQDSHIYSFYETNTSPTAKEGEPGHWTMTGDPAVLVDRHSARSGRSWEGNHLHHLPISSNHSGMVKFSEYSLDCGIVCDILRQFGQDARGVISRRWWWWEKEFAPKISFSGNPVFKMLFSDVSTASPAPPSKPQSTGSGPLKSSKSTEFESGSHPQALSTSESHLDGSPAIFDTHKSEESASDMHLEVPTQDQWGVNDLPNTLNDDEPSNDEVSQQAQLNFNKTIGGAGRSWEGYERVGVLFLTWQTETQHRLTDVDALRALLTNEFNFETHEFKIPSKEWQTDFAKAVADFTYNYDSPNNLAIIYYGGHGYIEQGNGLVELTGKVKEDVVVDGMLEDLRTCLRLPSCDILVILDDCNTTGGFNASSRERIGKQKIEVLTIDAAKTEHSAPNPPGWFTKLLTETLGNLLKANPHGFPSSVLYSEVHHKSPDAEPHLFNLSTGDHRKICICPPIPSYKPPKAKTKGELVLNLSLRLTGQQIETGMMNDIASHLQFIPHVEEIRFQNLSAPSKEIAKFMQLIIRAQKIRPLLRKLHARRQIREIQKSSQLDDDYPQSLFSLRKELSQDSMYDWSNVTQGYSHKSSEEPVSPPTKKARLGH